MWAVFENLSTIPTLAIRARPACCHRPVACRDLDAFGNDALARQTDSE